MTLTSGSLGSGEPPLAAGGVYRFGPFVLDARRRTLCRADSPVPLTAKAFDVLLFLVQHPHRLVTKEELLQTVWGDRFVEEGNLTRYMSHLRKALGDNGEETRLIVTVARKGYQFTADVRVVDAETLQPVQVTASDTLRDVARPIHERSPEEAGPTAPRRWRIAAALTAAAVIVVAAAYLSWPYIASMMPPRPPKIMLAMYGHDR